MTRLKSFKSCSRYTFILAIHDMNILLLFAESIFFKHTYFQEK